MYFMNNLDFIFKNKNKGCVLGVYILQRKNYIYIGFNRTHMFLENTGEIIVLIMEEWRKYADHSAHEIIFHV